MKRTKNTKILLEVKKLNLVNITQNIFFAESFKVGKKLKEGSFLLIDQSIEDINSTFGKDEVHASLITGPNSE